MANIGEPKKEIQIEPIPQTAPIQEPSPAPAPEPAKPDKELEPV